MLAGGVGLGAATVLEVQAFAGPLLVVVVAGAIAPESCLHGRLDLAPGPRLGGTPDATREARPLVDGLYN